jgi:ribosomal protein S12 methylthiotransferase accessory factor
MDITFDGDKVVTAHFGDHDLRTDQSLAAGGGNTAPAPFELFLASIGTCAGIYVKSFCDNRKIPTDKIRIVQTIEFNSETGLPSGITVDIKLPSDFPERYKASVINVADLCKVKKAIANPPQFKTIVSVAE